MTKNELEVIDTKKVERAINHISDICRKVENSTEEYKKTIDDIVFLQSVKAHKESGLTFHDYIHERTGMGRTTCTYLLRIGKYMTLSGMSKEQKKDFMLLPMRTILSTIASDPKGEEMSLLLENPHIVGMQEISNSIIDKEEQEEPEDKDDTEVFNFSKDQMIGWLTSQKSPECTFTIKWKAGKCLGITCKLSR